jgi:hypothetical protein
VGNIAANNSKRVLTVASGNFLSDPPINFFGGLVLSFCAGLVVCFCVEPGGSRTSVCGGLLFVCGWVMLGSSGWLIRFGGGTDTYIKG